MSEKCQVTHLRTSCLPEGPEMRKANVSKCQYVKEKVDRDDTKGKDKDEWCNYKVDLPDVHGKGTAEEQKCKLQQ